jgi:NADPH:quinone reductase-like Zn-dependent oxidoreductase
MNGYAVRFHEFGGPDVLVHEEVDVPAPGDGEVLLRVLACAVNRFDVDVREGTSRFPVGLPHVGGIEVVGRIAALGPGVSDWTVGDRVLPDLMSPCGDCRYCRGGRQSICAQPGFISFSTGGGYAEYLTCDESHLIPVPEALGDIQAAALQMAFATAWHMLFTQGDLRAGERVLIHSVGSGVGSAALQLAKLAGAEVIGTASSPAKLERAGRLGLDVGIDHTAEDVPDRVFAATGGAGADLVFDHVGGEFFAIGLESLAKGGRVVICGGHAGEVVPLDVIPFFRAEKRIIGAQSHTRAETERVLDLAAQGRVQPVVHETFPLHETRAATELVELRQNFGKVVIVP